MKTGFFAGGPLVAGTGTLEPQKTDAQRWLELPAQQKQLTLQAMTDKAMEQLGVPYPRPVSPAMQELVKAQIEEVARKVEHLQLEPPPDMRPQWWKDKVKEACDNFGQAKLAQALAGKQSRLSIEDETIDCIVNLLWKALKGEDDGEDRIGHMGLQALRTELRILGRVNRERMRYPETVPDEPAPVDDVLALTREISRGS